MKLPEHPKLKLPKYLKLKFNKDWTHTLTIKKWGIPILLFKVLRERFELKWYHWLLYPYFCYKVMMK